MKKLTKREIVLIYVLVCFVLIMGGIYLVLLPCYQQYQTLSTQLAEAEFQQMQMANAIENVPAAMETRDEASATLSGLEAPFSAHLPNEGLDMLLTPLCLNYGLAPKVLNISANAWTVVPTFIEAPLVYETTTSTAEGATNPTTTAPPAGTATGASTWTGVVAMELTGTQYDFQRLVDAVDARSDMIISSFEIMPETAFADGTITVGNTTTTNSSSGWVPELDGGDVKIKITFSVYMVDK